VLLGAGSAIGPLHVLLALGANVIAIDLDRPFIWKRLIELTKKSTGTITFPIKEEQKKLNTDDELCASAGCDFSCFCSSEPNLCMGLQRNAILHTL
jgi:hypothetical protein